MTDSVASTSAEAPGMRMICPACNRSYDAGELVCLACGSGLLEIPDAPLLSGKVLDGRYDIDGVVGTGGMGTVYRARQRGMEREVAIKILHAHYAHQPKAVKRFFREAQAASRLVHPNIVTVYDFGRSDEGHLYMVMELLEGWTLGDLIHYRAPLQPGLAIAIAVQICDALDEAHRRRFAHRDLKPDNVLVTAVEDGLWAKVLDFGIARAIRDKDAGLEVNHSTVEIAGTPSYMSPEQILGKEPDTRSDLYALGVILFELLTKSRPFDDDSSVAVCMKQLNEVPPRLSTVIDGVGGIEDVVARLLEKKADDRPATAAEVKALLLACPQAAQPLELETLGQLDPKAARALSQRTTRADAAMLMAQPTLDASNASNSPPLGEVIGRFRQSANLAGLAGLAFPARGAGSPPEVAAAASATPPRPKRQRLAAIAHVIADHPSALEAPPVVRWLDARRDEGWAISLQTQKAVLRVPLGASGAAATARAAVDGLVELQERALCDNLALRVGVAAVESGPVVADALDLSRRLAASSAHGVVSIPEPLGSELEHDVRPQTEVFLPSGEQIACLAVRPALLSGGQRELLWGRSIPLRRLGQLAEQARRAGPVRAIVTGAKGIGRSSLVRSFAAGRSHLYLRVSPGAAMWPGHTAAALVAAAFGVGPLTGRLEDLEGVPLVARDRDLLELLLCDRPTEDTPTLRSLGRHIADALARCAGDGPLVVVLDDVHLIDRASHVLIDAAVEQAEGRPWLVVATSRWLKPGMPFADAHRVDLRPLSLRASNSVLDAAGVGPRQRHALMAAAAGNPLALRLLADAWADGVATPRGEVIGSLLPAHLRGASAADADHAWVCAALAGEGPETLASRAATLYLDGGLTGSLAQWLADRLRRMGPVPAALAAAWRADGGEDPGQRAERCERLGLWRLAALEHEAALALVPEQERPRRQLRAAHMRARAGDVRGALAGWESSVRSGVARQRPTELLEFASVLLDVGEGERASSVLDQVAGGIDPARKPRAFAEALALKARAAVRRCDVGRAMTWLGQARAATGQLQRADARGARALEALTQEIRAEIAVAEGDRETARVNLRQARDAFRDLNRHGDALRCLVDLGRLELEGGLAARSCDTFRAASRLAKAAGRGREVLRAEVGLGEALVATGEVDDGAQRLRRALRSASDGEDGAGLAEATVGLARAMLQRGLWADAIRYAERARAATRVGRVRARARAVEAEAWAGQQHWRKAWRAFEAAIAVAAEHGDGLLRDRLRSLAGRLLGASASPPVPTDETFAATG